MIDILRRESKMAKKTLTEAFDVKPKETPKNGLKDFVPVLVI